MSVSCGTARNSSRISRGPVPEFWLLLSPDYHRQDLVKASPTQQFGYGIFTPQNENASFATTSESAIPDRRVP